MVNVPYQFIIHTAIIFSDEESTLHIKELIFDVSIE